MDLNDIASSLVAAFNGHDAERLANLEEDQTYFDEAEFLKQLGLT